MNKNQEKTLDSRYEYQGSILNLRIDGVQLPDGRKSQREIVEHSGGVAIIPVTDKGEIIMVNQYRKAVEETLMELPAGKLEAGEDPLDCAGRELEEETGYRAGEIERLISFHTSPGYSDELLYLYVARGLQYRGEKQDQDEFIEVEIIESDQIMGLIESGQIKDSKTIIGLLLYLKGAV